MVLGLTVGGQAAPTPGPSTALSFGRPRVVRLTLNRTTDATLLDCSAVGLDGRPAAGNGAGSGAVAVLTVEGVNFGVDGVHGVVVVVGNSPCALHPAACTPTRIVCETQLCRGECAQNMVLCVVSICLLVCFLKVSCEMQNRAVACRLSALGH